MISISKSFKIGVKSFNTLKNTFTPIEKLEEITALMFFSLITSAFPLACSSVNPVVPTTKFTPQSAVLLMVSTAAGAMVKSTNTSAPDSFNAFSKSSEPTIGTPILPIPAFSPASTPAKGVFGISIAATTSISSCSVIFLIMPEPILPAAPVTATFIIISSK